MKCVECGTEVKEVADVVTSYIAYSHSPRDIGKLVFNKLVQCPNCKRIDLLTIDLPVVNSSVNDGEKK